MDLNGMEWNRVECRVGRWFRETEPISDSRWNQPAKLMRNGNESCAQPTKINNKTLIKRKQPQHRKKTWRKPDSTTKSWSHYRVVKSANRFRFDLIDLIQFKLGLSNGFHSISFIKESFDWIIESLCHLHLYTSIHC